MSTIQWVIFIIGALVVVIVLAGFFVSFWRPAPKADEFRESNYPGTDYHGDGH
jgi:hypothetical protein